MKKRDNGNLTPEDRAHCFICGVMGEIYGNWAEFLPHIQPYGDEACALYAAGGAAQKNDAVIPFAGEFFGGDVDNVKFIHYTVGYLKDHNLRPVALTDGSLKFAVPPVNSEPEGMVKQ